MILQKWLVVNSRGTARVVGTKPRMAADEVAVFIKLELPDSIFEKPQLVATLKVPESAVPRKEITAEITDNIEEAILSATGLEMRLSVTAPGEGEEPV